MKNLILLLELILLTSCSVKNRLIQKSQNEIPISQQSNINNSKKPKFDFLKDTTNMSFRILPSKGKFKNDNILINLEFKNISNSTIRLLDMFEPVDIFFSLLLISKEGKIFNPFIGGFIDFGPNTKIQYIKILSNKSFIKTLNIGPILKEYKIILEPGIYKLEMRYHNNKGENCIVGSFKGNSIEVEIIN